MSARPRARDAGVLVGSLPPGPLNAITDVRGVRVGHATIVSGDDVRSGVTIIQPHEGDVWADPVFAGPHRLNGNGELTGLEWIRESGFLTSPVALTNTHSVGVVRDALIAAQVARRPDDTEFWALPVVGETWDGLLNDINGMHVQPQHVYEALATASDGPVAEGNVGSGTGMICHGFKGGIGTASRVVEAAGGATVGVLVQANHGRRERLSINGVPVGLAIPPAEVPLPGGLDFAGGGSIIVVAATDAPLLPLQCSRVAQRAGFGIARLGGVGENFSGDLFLAFATGNRGLPTGDYGGRSGLTSSVRMLSDRYITHLFDAVIEATEEAIVNALFAAETMDGRGASRAHAIPIQRVAELLGVDRAST
jgi:D-aminopeptidase